MTPVAATSELLISQVSVTEAPPPSPGGYYIYAVRFWLTETTGKSGAIITGIDLTAPNETDSTGPSCWISTIRVEPGGTLDVFDRGWDDLYYCAPSVISLVRASSITIVVRFTDDNGGAGTVTKTASLTERHEIQ